MERGSLVDAKELSEYLLSTSKVLSLPLMSGRSSALEEYLAMESPNEEDIEAHVKGMLRSQEANW